MVERRFAAFVPSSRASWSICALLVAAVTSGWCQGTVADPPPAKNFIIVQDLHNAPDLSSYGIRPLVILSSAQVFTSCTDDKPFDTPRLKMELEGVTKSPIPTVLDIDCGLLWEDADYSKNLSSLRNAIAAVRKARPDLRFGVFGAIPPTSWRWSKFNLNDPAFQQRWQKVNQKAKSDFVPYVDALFLDLYTIVPDPAVWEEYARMVLQTARGFNKPVYCFLWPQYYDLDQRGQRGPYLERSYWRLELDTCYKYADGIVLYDEPRIKWNPNAPWWQETLSFLRTIHGAASVQPGAVTVQPGAVTVTAPSGGENWRVGTTHAITWSYTGNPGSLVQILLLKQRRWYTTISSSTSVGSAGSGSFKWTIPSGVPAGNDYSVQVKSTSNAAITDTSSADFTVP